MRVRAWKTWVVFRVEIQTIKSFNLKRTDPFVRIYFEQRHCSAASISRPSTQCSRTAVCDFSRFGHTVRSTVMLVVLFSQWRRASATHLLTASFLFSSTRPLWLFVYRVVSLLVIFFFCFSLCLDNQCPRVLVQCRRGPTVFTQRNCQKTEDFLPAQWSNSILK